MLSIQDEKILINKIIAEGLKEILHKGLRVTDKNLGSLEDDVVLLMKALQLKNRIYDFAVSIEYNDLFKHFSGKIAYTLINSDDNMYQDLIEFNF